MVQNTLQLDGMDLYGYLFRIGAMTTAAAKWIDADAIQTLARWSTDTYIQTPHQELATISQQIARPWSG